MMGHFIPILRLLVLVGWSMVTLWAAPAYRRAVLDQAADGDYKQVALAVVGVALVYFQVNAFRLPPRTDAGTAAGLFLLAAGAAIVFVFIHLPRTPPGHKRALALTYLAILIACIVGGSVG
jgi:hypothetical protein